EHVVDEVERSLTDAVKVTKAAVESGKIVPGGGAPEMEVSLRLKQWAPSVGGREQLAIEAFASALEVIPRTLAENAGLDPIDMLVELRKLHEAGKIRYGVEVFKGKPVDMFEANVVEPLKVKKQAISGATEVAIMILRIDDVIASKSSESKLGGETGEKGKSEEEESETSED
ncbi:MAG: thermosome subunit, partial [Archaeoglobaceae archaeon]|nr:thermosome subunit [Archaeoglobaceae archaeon]